MRYNFVHALALLAALGLGIAYFYGTKKRWIRIAALAYAGLFTLYAVLTTYGVVSSQLVHGETADGLLSLAGSVPTILLGVGALVSAFIVMRHKQDDTVA
jgi:hypothetical protein